MVEPPGLKFESLHESLIMGVRKFKNFTVVLLYPLQMSIGPITQNYMTSRYTTPLPLLRNV